MNDKLQKKLEKWTRKASGDSLIFKSRGQIKGILKLGEMNCKESVKPLLKLLKKEDHTIKEKVYESLQRLTNQEAIDVLCDWYLDSRDPGFEKILIKNRLRVGKPFQNKVLIDLKLGRIEEVSNENNKDFVSILLKARSDRDINIKNNAQKVLHSLKNQGAIDELCACYLESRESKITEIIESTKYTCTKPFRNQVLIDLKLGRLDRIIEGKEQELPGILIDAVKDKDATIKKNALIIVTQKQIFINSLCRKALYENVQELLEMIRGMEILPEDLYLRALCLFFFGRYSQLDELDPEQELLIEVYQKCGKEMKERFFAQIRSSGINKYNNIIETSIDTWEGRILKKEDYEQDEMLHLIKTYFSQDELEKVFGLTRYCTLPYVLKIISGFKEKKRTPRGYDDLFKGLFVLLDEFEQFNSNFWQFFDKPEYQSLDENKIEELVNHPDPMQQCKGLYLISKRNKGRFQTLLSQKRGENWLFNTFDLLDLSGYDDLKSYKSLNFGRLPQITGSGQNYWIDFDSNILKYICAVPCHQLFIGIPEKLQKWIGFTNSIPERAKKCYKIMLQIIRLIIENDATIPPLTREIDDMFKPEDISLLKE